MNIDLKYILILAVLFLVGCGPKKGVVTKKKNESPKVETIDRRETNTNTNTNSNTSTNTGGVVSSKPPTSTDAYIQEYSEIAKTQMRMSKIPASIILAQGILESGSGRGRLAVKANNHFGIKCHGWTGAKIYHDDDRSQECFRKYQKAESSYADHSDFLTGRKRYATLFNLKPDDYKGWARGLKAAGYATDRKYPQKLISLIERYDLNRFDDEVLDNKTVTRVKVNSGVLRYIVEQGDTLYSLSRRFNTTVEAIMDLNNMNSSNLALGQELMIPN